MNLFNIGVLKSLIFLVLFCSCNMNNTKNKNAVINKIKVQSDLTNEILYFESKSWGLTSNHKIILIRNYYNEEFVYDSIRDIKIVGEDYIFYELKSDSLILYLEHPVSIPTNFSTNLQVKQIRLKGSEFRNYFENHGKLGVKVFD